MKLIRFGEPGREKPGLLLDSGAWVDTSPIAGDYDGAFFDGKGLERLRKWFEGEGQQAPTLAANERLGPPVARPGKIVCIGLNYSDHVRETGAHTPEEPAIFFKATSALSGPNDDVVIPKNAGKLDWEVELALVIGERARHVSEADALDYVAGYVLHNDYSEREFQLERGGQWVKGKSCDTFAPLGPFIATRDEIPDPGDLGMWLKVNGEIMQESTTSQMIFGVPWLVSYVSRFMTLMPGDVITTGTPAGVALGMETPRYLREGDVVELGIDGLGSSRQQVVKYPGD